MTAAICAAASAPALAEPSKALVRFEYHAADGCPVEKDFVERVRTRAPQFRVAGPAESARRFVVTLSELADGAADTHRGELVLREIDGRASARAITGASCDEVAAALSVIIAIELSPEAGRPEALAAPSYRDKGMSTC